MTIPSSQTRSGIRAAVSLRAALRGGASEEKRAAIPKRTPVIDSAWAARHVGEARKMAKKKTRVVLRKKVSVRQPMTLVDRPSTHSLTNPRAVERYLDAMTLQRALILADK